MSKKKVSFSLSPEIVGNANSGILLGDFNNWDAAQGVSLKKEKDGSLAASLSLESGKSYEYRYLLDDGRWVNDANADEYIFVNGFQVNNCVVSVPAATSAKKTVSAKKTTAAAAPKKEAVKKVAKSETQDLTKIEGIGKKIAELLVADGIDTFEKLGKASQKVLKGILETAGSRYKMHDPKTWPKQAKLAAAAKWDELKTLQDSLKGGK